MTHCTQFDLIVTYCIDMSTEFSGGTLTASGSISDAMYVSNSNPSSFNTRSPLEARERREGAGGRGNGEERERGREGQERERVKEGGEGRERKGRGGKGRKTMVGFIIWNLNTVNMSY